MKIEINSSKKWQNLITVKMGLLAFLGILLLIPLEMIKTLIRERESRSEDVKKEIFMQWAGNQIVTGPVLNIPVRINSEERSGESSSYVFHIMPEIINVKGDIETEKRYRSIYKTVVYSSDLNISGDFNIPVLNTGKGEEIVWDEVYFSMGISDNRGLKGSVRLKTDSVNTEAIPGLNNTDLFDSGITFPHTLTGDETVVPFSIGLRLSGSENLSFSPVGKTTFVNLSSSWHSPGFTGNFLPSSRTVSNSGFEAEWQITDLNRNFPQIWKGRDFSPEDEPFGVDLVLPVDHYQKSLRSAKYGVLFIALTFMALLFAEMITGERIHIFHYLLISLGLVLFFSLLNSLSEHTGFNTAYLLSSMATISLISLFLRSLKMKIRPLSLISVLLVFLYSFIFILLTLNDYAYLTGNIGLFIFLAFAMWLSSKYDLFIKKQGEDE